MYREQNKPAGGQKRVRRKLATVLAADVANYSAMVAASEEETIRALRIARRAFAQRISSHNGRIANTAGDSIIAVFESPVEAVRCAVEVQKALATTPKPKAKNGGRLDIQVKYRIGIHLGDILLDGRDVLGDAVNLAARLESIAQPGAISISTVIKDQIGNRFQDYPIADLGEQSLKNIPQPVRVYELLSERGSLVKDKPRDLAIRRALVMGAAAFIVMGAVGLGLMAAQSLKFALSASNLVSHSTATQTPAESTSTGAENDTWQ